MPGQQVKPKAAPIWKKPRRLLRYGFLRLARLHDPPRTVALGLAIGVFVGILPIVPFHTVTALALAFIFRGSKVAAALGTWVSNPLDLLPHYLLLYYVGRKVLPLEAPPLNPERLGLTEVLSDGWDLLAVLLTGGLILAVPASLLTYLLTYQAIKKYRTVKAAHQAAKKAGSPNLP